MLVLPEGINGIFMEPINRPFKYHSITWDIMKSCVFSETFQGFQVGHERSWDLKTSWGKQPGTEVSGWMIGKSDQGSCGNLDPK